MTTFVLTCCLWGIMVLDFERLSCFFDPLCPSVAFVLTKTCVTHGAPSAGIFGVPDCESTTGSYELCEFVRYITRGRDIPLVVHH